MTRTATYRLWSDIRSRWCNYEVVGEYYHIDDICRLLPPSWDRSGEELLCDVELIPEPDNPYDEWAVSVRVNGLPVGYLSRDDAAAWAAPIRRITASGLTAITDGRIYVYEAPDWANLDRNGDPRTEIRARANIKLGEPHLALPLNNPPVSPYTLLPQSSVVQVTKEDEHFSTLCRYVPPSGRGLLYVTLHEVTSVTTRRSKTLVEVRIDNQRIGQLTPQMSQRFLPMIQHLEKRGLLTACQGDITGSSVAAEVRIDAIKANEADDSTLNGPAATVPTLHPALDDLRRYRVPAAYNRRSTPTRRPAPEVYGPTTGQSAPAWGVNNPATPVPSGEPAWSAPSAEPVPIPEWRDPSVATPSPGREAVPITGPGQNRTGSPHCTPGSARPSDAPERRAHVGLLVALLLIGGFFSVLIPHVGPIVWLTAWGTAIYLVVRSVRRALKARRQVDGR